MIHLTDSAVTAVRGALSRSPGPVAGLRLMVQSGGCAGFKYSLGIVSEADPEDVVVEQQGITIFVDPASEPHLKGTVMDFVESLEGSGFAFDNPNAGSKCSCGKSFC